MRRLPMMVVLLSFLATNVAFAEEDAAVAESRRSFRDSGSLLDATPRTRQHMVSFFVGLPYGYWYYGGFPFGLGARYYIPLLHNGFIPPVNDSFGLEFGADFAAVFGNYFAPLVDIPVEAVWNFHLSSKFTAYAKAGLALEFAGFTSGCNSYGVCYSSGLRLVPVPIGGVGILFKVSNSMVLRAEAAYPWFKVGLGFML
jgi:hypothetical protein